MCACASLRLGGLCGELQLCMFNGCNSFHNVIHPVLQEVANFFVSEARRNFHAPASQVGWLRLGASLQFECPPMNGHADSLCRAGCVLAARLPSFSMPLLEREGLQALAGAQDLPALPFVQDEEEDLLIYNWAPSYTGKVGA